MKIFDSSSYLLIFILYLNFCFIKSEDENGYEPIGLSSHFSVEWEKKMSDYEPDYVYLIPIEYKEKEVFFETIEKVPARIRGAYLLEEKKQDKIEFSMFSPSGVLIYFNTTSHQIFDFNVTESGVYQIVFNNKFANAEMKVTFTMNTGQNPILKKEDLSVVDQKIDGLMEFIKKYSVSFKMRHNVHSMRYQRQQKANKYFYTFSILETVVLIGLSIWQFYYMRQLVKTVL